MKSGNTLCESSFAAGSLRILMTSRTSPGEMKALCAVTADMGSDRFRSGDSSVLSTFSAANKMHDLQPVAFCQARCIPLVARNDVTIQFNRHTVELQTHIADERSERKGTVVALILPIDFKLHGESFYWRADRVHGAKVVATIYRDNCQLQTKDYRRAFPIWIRLLVTHSASIAIVVFNIRRSNL